MKNSTLTEILICIQCNNQLWNFINDGKDLECTHCRATYNVVDKVYVFLPEKKEIAETQTGLHKETGTSFEYIDHYQKDSYASDYFAVRDSGTEHGERRVREFIASEIKGGKGRILDVGCGKAWVAQLFCPAGYEVISMDISLRNTTKAMEIYPYENHYAVVADAFSLPFKNNSFDYIVASEIIEHVHDPEEFIRNLFNILKPGGKLIATTPYKEKIQYSLCVHCNKPTPVHAHLHSFDEQILKSLYLKGDLNEWRFRTFGNKILIHLRTHTFLKFLNHRLWKKVDSLSSLIYNVPSRIMVIWKKSNI